MPRTPHDMRFTLTEIKSVHVRSPGPDYWRGFLRPATDAMTPRFQFSPPWRSVYAREVESALVRIRLADGSVGWGEATCPIAPEVVCTLLNGFVSDVVRDREFMSVAALVDTLYDAQRCRGYLAGHYQDAVAALDIALHDALGSRAGCPVRELLAAAPVSVLPCYLSGARAPTRDERIELLQRWAVEGSTAVKIFLRGALAADLEEFAALRAAVPALTWWAADALWTYDDADTAARAKRQFGYEGARWLECPMLPEDLAAHAALHDVPGAPVALGEHFRTALQSAPWLDPRALDVLQPDIGRTGFVEGARIAEAALARGIAVTPHMGGALDVMQAATLQFAAAYPSGLPCEYQHGLAQRMRPALQPLWTLGRDGFCLSDVAGLGIDVDADALQPFIVA